MKTKSIKLPGPNHLIAIEPNPARVTVSVAGHIIADTQNALTLREAPYAPVQYIPQKDVDVTLLKQTEHQMYCPYRGDCAYYSIPLGGERSVNAAATYKAPYAAVDAIRDHVAFYPDRVDAIGYRGRFIHPSTSDVQSMSVVRTLGRRASVWVAATVVVHTLWTSAAPTMTYPLYASKWGLTHTATAAIFAVFSIVVVAVPLFSGDISDYMGRRSTILIGLAVDLGAVAIAVLSICTIGLAVSIRRPLPRGMALCGACTLHVDSEPTRSCV